MSDILVKVQKYLDEINFGKAGVPEILLEQFAERSKELLGKKLNGLDKKDKFTVRMSNVGRPLCQLQLEKAGIEGEPPDNFFPMKMMFGDMIELMAVLIIKAAGIEVQSEQIKIADASGLEGTYDIEIDNKIWDIKSASDYAFNNKFKDNTIQRFYENDDFGYVCQGIGYAKSVGRKFGGWIAINKQTGEWTVLEAEYDDEFEAKVLNKIEENKKALNENVPFKRCYEDKPEIYYKTKTGNRILGSVCSYCRFKYHCWPEVRHLPKIPSKAVERPYEYYTYIPAVETSIDT